jgi:hypothetical protein
MMDHLLNLRTAFFAGLLVLLAACGGSEGTLNGSNGTTPAGSGATPDDTTPRAASVRLLSQNSQIPSDSSSGTELTAIVRDSNNNFLSGITVTFDSSSGGIQEENDGITDASGRARANLNAAGNPANRVVTVGAVVLGTSGSDSVQVEVAGTTLSVVGPATVTVGDQVNYLISLRDSAGEGISFEAVEVTSSQRNTVSQGNAVGAPTLETETSGKGELTVQYTANSVGADPDQLTVQALGLSQTQEITVTDDTFTLTSGDGTLNAEGVTEVSIDTDVALDILWTRNGDGVSGVAALSATRGDLADSSPNIVGGAGSTSIRSSDAGPATVTAEGNNNGPTAQLKLEFIAVDPSAINVQAAPSSIGTNESSTVRAIVRDDNGNLVKNQTISFTLDDVSGGGISSGSAVTDSFGRAQTTYTASDLTSATDGVKITATVQGTPAITSSVTLTVGGKARFVTIGSDYSITKGDGTYSSIFTVLVSDASGTPVEGATVYFSSEPTGYRTGCLIATAENADDQGDPLPASRCGNFISKVGEFSLYSAAPDCANEDLNRNGALDDGEDTNNSEELEPGGGAKIQSPVTTDESGTGRVIFEYPSEYALWYFYKVNATTLVDGTEDRDSAVGILLVLAEDVANADIRPPNLDSPFGDGGC